MKILICGMDGYIGWPLALHRLKLGDEVIGIDNFSRRKNVDEIGSWSATPILSMEKRMSNLKQEYSDKINFFAGDLTNPDFANDIVRKFQPTAIVHLAEQPSAPYSMIDQKHTVYTQHNNVIGTLNLLFAIKNHSPKSYLVKLGTLGEYGTPGIDIPEGFFEIEFRGKKATLPFPKQAGSWYHLSKVHDTNNITLACKLWGLCSTDIMQGVVYGTRTNEIKEDKNLTRFDFDEVFGTVINRFCAQAVIGCPLTLYGIGKQTRGFLALVDSIQCISLLIDNPPEKSEYRVVNQFDERYQIIELAEKVKKIGNKKGLDVQVDKVQNPRVESEEHYYKVDHQKLLDLGFKHTRSLDDEIEIMLEDLMSNKDRILEKKDSIIKGVTWREGLSKKNLQEVQEKITRLRDS